MDDGAVLLPDEVAAKLRCSRRQVYDLFDAGELLGFRVGRHIKIHAVSVRDYIDRHSNVGAVPAREAEMPELTPSPALTTHRASKTPLVAYRHLRRTPRTSLP